MKQKVDLPTLAETALLPLYGRYCWHQNQRIDFEDPFAMRVVESIDYDFGPTKNKIGEYGLAVWGSRTFLLDSLSKQTLDKDGFVVNLGVGLDDPFQRIWRGKGMVIDVDFPEILEFRDRLIDQHEKRMIFRESFLDFKWVEPIQNAGIKDPQICLAGVTMYLKEDQMEALLQGVKNHLPNARISFDALSPRGIKMLNKGMRSSKLPQEEVHWGLKDKKSIENWIGTGHEININPIFIGLPKDSIGFKTKVDIFFSKLLGINYFADIIL